MLFSRVLSVAAFLSLAVLVPHSLVYAQSSDPVPLCESTDTDSDGDGWGWENEKSCLVPKFRVVPLCAFTDSDSDGDGWGWENDRSCRVSEAGVVPTCEFTDSDSDGDGWGWENERSCQVSEARDVPICESTDSDTDGDGWGWENDRSCLVGIVVKDFLPCKFTDSDPDGDGWGWENDSSCIVGEPIAGECLDGDGDGWGWNGLQSCQLVVAPDLKMTTVVEANELLQDVGISLAVVNTEFSQSVAVGVIIRQEPAAGEELEAGQVVSVVLSLGPENVVVQIPNVVGLMQIEAREQLHSIGLVMAVTTQPSEAIMAGKIITQQPTADTDVSIGSEVMVIVSSGPEVSLVEVPSLTNLTRESAQTALNAVGLVLGELRTERSNSVAVDSVIRQQPAAGEELNPGQFVSIVVSLGPEIVQVLVEVPNVTGLSQAAAAEELDAIGLVLGVVTTQSSETVDEGKIISQQPSAETDAAVGSEVKLVVSSGAEVILVEVPALTNLTQESSQVALNVVGLLLGEVGTEYSDSVAVETVIRQTPAAGEEIETGEAVSVVLSLGPEVVLVQIPDVVGLTQAAAVEQLDAMGLVLGMVTTQSSETVAEGKIISQQPSAETEAAVGSEVKLVVSSGSEVILVDVPALTNLTQESSQVALNAVGLLLGEVGTEYSDSVAVETVIRQTPAAGEEIETGEAVSVVLSLGPEVVLVQIPDVVGLTQAAGEEQLDAIGLELGMVTTQSSETVTVGNIISQQPSAETEVAAGSEVIVVVSSGAIVADADGDTIENELDQCPDTPIGEFVDEVGCGSTQLDTDNDGVNDSLDECPETTADTDPNEVGCALSQLDSDNDGVSDADDVFPDDATESMDLDGDGIGDNADDDRDGDDVKNEDDFFPDDSTASIVPTLEILSPSSLTTVGSSPIEVRGIVDNEDATIVINGQEVPQNAGTFVASVALDEGTNTIVVRAIDANGREGLATATVALDKTPPYITVQSPLEDTVVYNAIISVGGLVNDIVRGTISEDEAAVTVNGITASVSNRSYLVEEVSLVEGDNELVIRAADAVGNTSELKINVSYEPQVSRVIELVSGQGQKAEIQKEIAQPLAVKLTEDGEPVADKVVVFRVIEGDGLLAPGSDEEGNGVVVKTDEAGLAEVEYRLGSRAGMGNHRVRARAVGFDGEAEFFASAEYGDGIQVGVIAGNNQRGSIKQPLAEPFVLAVTDQGANLIPNAEIVWEVVTGGGEFIGGEATITTFTDMDGRASAKFVLGSKEGLDGQRVIAKLAGTAASAGFTVSGFVPGDAGDTSLSGVVLDNQDLPLPSVTVRVDGTSRQALTDEEGQFTIEQVPVGPVKLIAEGSTTTRPGEWPTLSYQVVTVPGVNNPLASPVYLVEIDTENAVMVGAEDVTVTHPDIPGFELEVEKGSVTFPDGSKEGMLSITRVNANKVPMPPPNGMQPQLIVTIQPHGAVFDPPARLTIPNTDGHLPNAEVEMYSYDHDLEEFVTIGLGTVSSDGSLITSSNGVGVIKAGWHCGSQPGGGGCGHNCGYCEDCDNNCNCVTDTARQLEDQTVGNCATEYCGGGSQPDDNDFDASADRAGDCKIPGCENGAPKDIPDDGDISIEDAVCKTCADGEIKPDPSKEGVFKCGDGSPGQSCLVCKDGNCVPPECEAPSGAISLGYTAPEYVLKLVTQVEALVDSIPVIGADLEPFLDIEAKRGRKCCKDCENFDPQGSEFTEFGGKAGIKGEIFATVPGLGGAKEFPPKNIGFGLTVKAKGDVSLLAARVKFEASGATQYTKLPDCPGEDCGSISVGTPLQLNLGPTFRGKVELVSCTGECSGNEVVITGIDLEADGGVEIKGFVGGKASSGDQCGGDCFGASLESVKAVFKGKAKFTFAFKTVEYEDSLELVLHEGGTFGAGSCT